MARIARIPTVVLTALTALTALAGLVAFTAPAHAETGYKFWGYYHLENGRWTASAKGADSYIAQDGDVEGFRYATTSESDFERPPRALPAFADICAGTQAGQGEKRLGIVLDYGTAQDAPDGETPPAAEAECAVVPAGATTQQALESVQPVRVEQGLVCGIGGYPPAGCAEEIKDASVPANEKPVDLALPGEDAPDESQSSLSTVLPLVGIGAVVLVLGGGALALSRRRRT